MNPISIAYLVMVIVAFVGFEISLFGVHLYVNSKRAPKPVSRPAIETPEAAAELSRAA